MAPLVGILLHAIGGLAAGTNYVPFRKISGWSWQTYWLIMCVVAYLIMPSVAAWFVAPQFLSVLWKAPASVAVLVFIFGILWGIGGLAFGLTVRYLGLSLGFAMGLGLCITCGTLVPPIVHGEFGQIIGTRSGQTMLLGIAVCLAGIAMCGYACVRKEREVSAEQKRTGVAEFSLSKGFIMAAVAGLMSSFMAFGIDAGRPISQIAVDCGIAEIQRNVPVLVLVMAGNAVANIVWCVLLGFWAGSLGDYASGSGRLLVGNYFFAILAGIIGYNEFFWYGMGTTKMGQYDFSSWSIHLAFVIVFSSLWGIFFHEWHGVRQLTRRMLWGGLVTLIISTAVIGAGNCISTPYSPEATAMISTINPNTTTNARN
jgi:L-rhamnose-H+ transport protein